MGLTLTDIGIQTVDLALVEKVDRERKVEVKSIMASNGGFGAAEAFDPTHEFTIAGRGDVPAVLALGVLDSADLPISDLTGGVTIVHRLSEGQKNDDFQTWEATGTHYPGAS